ncbi:uncharacterized protein LOC129234924 [Uloborus diversus]|uniref:uncharacterized protein LOC129234924 n=1 Tax=Uloborus diversus TaxID=327109 RepID=UPI0024097815|nr:uncharacterized protein LOC129234924 [Uloborus diversus]
MQYKLCKPRLIPAGHALKSELYQPCSVVHIELVTSWPVTALWILLSWLVSTVATTAYVHPEWFVKEHEHADGQILEYDRKGLVSTLGMVSVCYHQDANELECHNFGEDFPTGAWQTSYVLFGSGCVLLTWCSILAFCNVWIVGRRNRQLVAVMVGRIQLVAVIMIAITRITYFITILSSIVQVYCGPKWPPLQTLSYLSSRIRPYEISPIPTVAKKKEQLWPQERQDLHHHWITTKDELAKTVDHALNNSRKIVSGESVACGKRKHSKSSSQANKSKRKSQRQ